MNGLAPWAVLGEAWLALSLCWKRLLLGSLVLPPVGLVAFVLLMFDAGGPLWPWINLIPALPLMPLAFGPLFVAWRVLAGRPSGGEALVEGYQCFGALIATTATVGAATFIAFVAGACISSRLALALLGLRQPPSAGTPLGGAYSVAVLGVSGAAVALVLSCLGMAYMDIIDRHSGTVEALTTSWRVTRGHRFALSANGLVLGALFVVGTVACGVGLLVTIPMAALSLAVIYRRLLDEGVAQDTT